jgi:histidinol-phosphate aminotransferase
MYPSRLRTNDILKHVWICDDLTIQAAMQIALTAVPLGLSLASTIIRSKEMAESVGVAARLARPNILELQPYRCARDDYATGILLDANENSFGPPIRSESTTSIELERYPDPYQIPLKEKLAAFRGHGLRPEHIFVGVGSDEAIDLLMRIFCKPGHDKIMTTPPTYGMYKVSAKVNDVDIVNVPLTPDFAVRIPEVTVMLRR